MPDDVAWLWVQVGMAALCEAAEEFVAQELARANSDLRRRWSWKEELKMLEDGVGDPENPWWSRDAE